ncbi:hypothetical protein ACWCP6_29945 [Streptomyces sp. NPDC002004]
MTAHIRRRWRTSSWGPAAVAVSLAVLAGCSGGASDGSAKASVSGLRDKARAAAKGTRSCPVRYDLAKAADKAGVSATAKAGRVSAELDEKADSDSPLARSKGALLECDYRLGGEPLFVETVAVERGRAVGLMAPHIDMDAGLGIDALKAYLGEVEKADLGTAVITPSGNVASVRIPVDGAGDIALVITFGDNRHTALTGHQVSAMTEELARQAKW